MLFYVPSPIFFYVENPFGIDFNKEIYFIYNKSSNEVIYYSDFSSAFSYFSII